MKAKKNAQIARSNDNPLVRVHAIPEYVESYVGKNKEHLGPKILVFTYEEGRGDRALYSISTVKSMSTSLPQGIVKKKIGHSIDTSVSELNLEGTARNRFDAADITRRIINYNQCMVEYIVLSPLVKPIVDSPLMLQGRGEYDVYSKQL